MFWTVIVGRCSQEGRAFGRLGVGERLVGSGWDFVRFGVGGTDGLEPVFLWGLCGGWSAGHVEWNAECLAW